jgi:phosphomevalonate kinase
MAVDRRARCTITPTGEGWVCEARGFNASATVSRADLQSGQLPANHVARPVAAAVRALGVDIPAGARVTLDTRDFFSAAPESRKLGIGSSAAICTAACRAVAELAAVPVKFEQMLAAHRWQQNSHGSGIDVAAACYGGLIRFQSGTCTPVSWPSGLHYQFFWTGESATTSQHIKIFDSWRAGADTRPLDALCAASDNLFADSTMDALSHYVGCLQQLDQSAHLGIYTPAHNVLDKLANCHQVVYKPCGAGGGDIGIALSEDSGCLARFAKDAVERDFAPLSMEIADDGIKPTC